jgi:transketolase
VTTIQASPTTDLDRLCVDTIRMLSVDAVEHAKSGHPGTPMALAPIGYVLYTRVMRHSPQHPDWPDRDRFVLSAGHASMLLYSLLYLTGYGLSLEDIKRFRQLGSPCAGHSEYGLAPGIEATTGPLGQGLGTASASPSASACSTRAWAPTSSTTTRSASPPTGTCRRGSPPRRRRWPVICASRI